MFFIASKGKSTLLRRSRTIDSSLFMFNSSPNMQQNHRFNSELQSTSFGLEFEIIYRSIRYKLRSHCILSMVKTPIAPSTM